MKLPRFRLPIVLVISAYILAMLPHLGRLEFSDGVEHFNLATVQEMNRDGGSWIVPTLQGSPRVVKPPLTAWMTSLLVRPDDVARLSSTDPDSRRTAFERFVFRARLPNLICAAFLLLGVYQLGCVIADRQTGLYAALMCGSCLLFLYQARRATTDMQLAVWVTWTNVFLATALIQRRPPMLIAAGVTLGLAMLAKGPHVAILMTVIPILAYRGLARWLNRTSDENRPSIRDWLKPLAIATVLAITIGLTWYLYVYFKYPGVASVWFREAIRKDVQVGRNSMQPDPWYAYNTLLYLLLPWTAWVLLGAWQAIPRRDATSPARMPPMLPVLLVVLPILVMSFFAEKKTRYLLPLVGSASVLAGWAFNRNEEYERERIPGVGVITAGKVAGAITIVASIMVSIGLAVVGAMGGKGYRTAGKLPWFTPAEAICVILVSVTLLATGLLLSRRSGLWWILSIVVVSCIGTGLKLRGEYNSPGDADDRPQQQLADDIWRTYPTAKIFTADNPIQYGQLNRPAIVVSIYTNRILRPLPSTLPVSRTEPWILISDGINTEPPVMSGWKRWKVLPLRAGKRYVDVLE